MYDNNCVKKQEKRTTRDILIAGKIEEVRSEVITLQLEIDFETEMVNKIKNGEFSFDVENLCEAYKNNSENNKKLFQIKLAELNYYKSLRDTINKKRDKKNMEKDINFYNVSPAKIIVARDDNA